MTRINLYPAINFFFSRLTDEEKLINLCSRVRISDEIRARITGLISNKNFDWNYFLKIAKAYDITPLIYRHIQTFTENIPAAAMQTLRTGTGFVFARNVRMMAELAGLTERFQETGLEIVFTKGVPFMMDVYHDKALRSFSDMDILANDMRLADKVLTAAGAKPYNGNNIFKDYRAQRVYAFKNGMIIDLHQGFLGRMLHNDMLKIDMKNIWHNKREICFDGVKVYTLDLIHTLLYHCLHVSIQHSFSGVKWYVDMNEFLVKYSGQIEWGDFLASARKYKVRKAVYYSLFFTKNMFGARVPDNVLEEFKDTERKRDKYVFTKIRSKNTEIDYLAELTLFDSTRDSVKFVIFSLIMYPYLMFHFVSVFGKMIKQILNGSREASDL